MDEVSPGGQLGPYRLEEELGRGGMGTVFRAVHRELERSVALKVIHPHLVEASSNRQRFLREAQIMARFHHPNVVRLLDYGESRDSLYLAMELLIGSPLGERIKEGSLDPAQVLPLARDLAAGVSALHAAGILHRDIKPQNLFLTRDGQLKLMDLGLAKSTLQTALTAEGHVSGTLPYLPPELMRGAPELPSGDVYQVGLVLHEMITGRYPYEQPPFRYLLARKEIPPPRILAMDHPHPELEPVVVRCLAADPENRYPDGHAILEALGPADTSGSPGGAGGRPAAPPAPSPTRALLDRTEQEEESAPTRVIVVSIPPAQTTPALRPGLAGIGALALAAALLVILPITNRRHRPAPAPVVTPSPRAPPFPAGTDLLDLTGTVAVFDRIFPGEEEERRLLRDPLLASFRRELEDALLNSDILYMVRNNRSVVEYWPDPPVPAELGRGIRLVPLARPDEAVAVTEVTSSPVRRIVMTLRPDEAYRITGAGPPVEFTSPMQRLGQNISLFSGPGSVLATLYPMGKPYRLHAIRHSDHLTVDPGPTSHEGLGGTSFNRYLDITDDDALTVLVLPRARGERFVWARVPWRPTPRGRLKAAQEMWQRDVEGAARGLPTRGAELRMQAELVRSAPVSKGSEEDLKSLVIDGRQFVYPQVVLLARKLVDHESAGIRRGAVCVLGMLGGESDRDTIKGFLKRSKDRDDWIHAMEALARLGDATARPALLQALERNRVRPWYHWTATYLRAVPDEILGRLVEPEPEDPPKWSTRLVDAAAAYLAGRTAAPYLLKLPARRCAGKDGFPAVLALRLMDTAQSRRRLQEIARELQAPPATAASAAPPAILIPQRNRGP